MDGRCSRRVNEFFPVKKRFCSSSNPLPSQSFDKLQPLPNKKNNLDGYLVAVNGDSPEKKLQALDICISGDKKIQVYEGGTPVQSSRNEEPKRKTPFLLQHCSYESSLLHSPKLKGNESICSSIPNENLQPSINMEGGNKDTDNKPEEPKYENKLAELADENLQSSITYCEGKGSEHDEVTETAGVNRKNELNEFANNFLSMCFSGIASTTTFSSKVAAEAQASTVKGEIVKKAYDTNNVVTGTQTVVNEKSHCIFTPRQSEIAVHGRKSLTDDLRDGAACMKVEGVATQRGSGDVAICTKLEDVSKIPVGAYNESEASDPIKRLEFAKKPSTSSELTFESPTVSKRQDCTSVSGKKRKIDSTPRSKSANRRKRTPYWNGGTSVFSPGDDFWDEAISMVEGLLPNKADGLSKLPVINRKTGERNFLVTTSISHLTCSNSVQESHRSKLQTDKRNLRNHHDGTVHSKESDLESQKTPLPGTSIHLTENGCAQDGIKDLKTEISPLPVRKFDFSFSPNKANDVQNVVVSEDKSFLPVGNPNSEFSASSMPVSELPKKKSEDPFPGQLKNESEKILTDEQCNNLQKHTPLQDDQSDKAKSGIYHPFSNSNSTVRMTESPCKDMKSMSAVESKISDWLPETISSIYAKKGLTKLYPWQVECLKLKGVLEGKNLIYCASTSAGKSLVAEILTLRKVIATGKKAVLVLPYVSICSEKAEHLETLLEASGKTVCSFFGTRGGASLPKDSSIAVCTIEKANSLVNKLLEECRLPELAVVVIDELHMVGDKDRGYLLELMLTKLRYAAGEGKDSAETKPEVADKVSGLQIIGMSATMPNAGAVAKWLQAALYETNFRPVPLDEYIKVGNSIYNKDMEVVRTIRKNADLAGKDPDHVVELCHEVVQEGHSVLLFCASRKACETSAKHVARFLPEHEFLLRDVISGPENAASALEELKKCPAGLDPVLAETLPKGVAYHHAGLTVEERELVEACYRSGIVRVLTATSTLAAGVNLPARRVVFRQPRIGKDFVDGTRYRQMAGRAGRAGIDTKGESILICKPEELKRMCSLINEECQPLLSCLADDKNGMTRAILEVVAGGIVQSAADVERYVKCTLLNSTESFEEVVKSAQDSLRWLCRNKFLEWDQNTKLYNSTPLGKAAFGSSLSPEESLIVFEDLAKAREGFVLASDLHLVYQVTPIYVELEPDWGLYYKRFVELSAIDQAVGNRVGVMEPFLMRMAHGALIIESSNHSTGKSPRRKHTMSSISIRKSGRNSPTSPPIEHTLRVCKRFYVSLVLAKLIQETPLMEVCESFKVARGMVQALQEISGRFASMVSAFCERLGWHDLEGLVSKFQSRVCFGVRAEIVELAEIPYVKASRARALYKAGLRTPQAVAQASIPELLKALFDTSSWISQDGSKSSMHHRIQMGMVKKIQNGARKLVIERAEAARVAAFSALCALGVDVPAALSKPLADSASLTKNEPEGTEEEKNCSTIDDGYTAGVEPAGLHKVHVNALPKPDEACKLPSHSDDVGYESLNGVPCSGLINQNGMSENGGSNMGPVYVDSLAGRFEEIYPLWKKNEQFFFDLHFSVTGRETGYPIFDIKGLAICWVGSPVYYISLWDANIMENPKQEVMTMVKERWARLAEVLCMDGVQKITWNWKNQVLALKQPTFSCGLSRQFGQINAKKHVLSSLDDKSLHLPSVSIKSGLIDLQIAAWVLWPDEESVQNFSLEQEVKKRLPGSIAAKASREGRWVNQMGRVAHNGCCRRVAQIRALHTVIWKLIMAEGLNQPLLQQEMPLVPLLAELEVFGITVDIEECKRARRQLEMKIKELEGRAHELAGVLFSLSVPAEVASVLYTHLKLPVPVGCSTKKQHPSTDKHALDALKGQHPIVEVIKEHRTLSKVLHSTLGSILFKARPIITTEGQSGSMKSIVYRVQGRWLQTSTATGRLSMEEPNLQCVEHSIKFTIMQHSEGSSEEQPAEECTINARNLFMASQEGWTLLSADYSQIEVRLMAHFSEDPHLIELLRKPAGDLFKMITSRWTGIAEEDITAKQRDVTKRLVYGILYGMGVSALADQLECSVPEATEKYKRFKSAFPEVARWLKEAVARCREQGYVSTLAGRRRYLDKIKCGSLTERAKAERQAVNSICQGSAADLIKIAMNKLSSVESLETDTSCSSQDRDASLCSLKGKFRLLLQIHDELLLEVDKAALPEVSKYLRSCMEGAASLKVPLRVKLQAGPRWGSLQPLEI